MGPQGLSTACFRYLILLLFTPVCGNCSMAKVLVVNPYWDTLGGGGRYAATFAKLLADLDWSVGIVWPDSAISGQVKSRFNLDLASCRFIHPRPPPINYQLSFWVSDGSLPLSLSRRPIIHLWN